MILALFFACATEDPAPLPPPVLAEEEEADPAEDEAEAPVGTPVTPELLSPSPGAVVTVPWIPLAARLPASSLGAPVTVWLDGVDITDPLGILRSRWANIGGGADYLATLDLALLPPGPHALRLSVGTSPPLVLEGSFDWQRPPCPVDLRVQGSDGQDLPARVLVRTPTGPHSLAAPDAARVDRLDRDAALSSVFVLAPRRIWLPQGSWTLVATRGIRHDLDLQSFDLGPGCEAGSSRTFTLTEVVSTPGQRTADLHVHTGMSGDSAVPDRARFESLRAADLDLVVITDHKRIRPVLPAAGLAAPGLRAWSGTEAMVKAPKGRTAHANAFPLDPATPYPPEAGEQGMAWHIDTWRALGALVQLNHPRGLNLHPEAPPAWRGHALWAIDGLQRGVPMGEGANAWLQKGRPETGTTPLDFDLLEVVNRFSWEQYLQVRQDWFLLLHLGRFVTGTGNSDSHALAVELAGFPVNLVQGQTDAELLASLRQGRVSVSNGPVLDLLVGGQGPGAMVQGSPVQVEVRVRAAPWVPVQELRLVVDGQDRVFPLPSPLPAEGHLLRTQVDLAQDGWILAEAGAPVSGEAPGDLGMYAWVAPGYRPMAFTNPVRVDVDGDGAWTPKTPMQAATLAAQGPPGPTPAPRKAKAPAR